MGQTDGQTDGRIAVSLNAPLRRGHNNSKDNSAVGSGVAVQSADGLLICRFTCVRV